MSQYVTPHVFRKLPNNDLVCADCGRRKYDHSGTSPTPAGNRQYQGMDSARTTGSMTFGEAIRTCFAKYTTFSGRAARPEYWWFALFELMTLAAAAVLGGITGSSGFMTFLIIATILVFLLPSLAVTVRRLHDTGHSGWLYLVCLIPLGGIVLFVFTITAGDPGSNSYGARP